MSEIGEAVVMNDAHLYKVEMSDAPIRPEKMDDLEEELKQSFNFDKEDLPLVVFKGEVENIAYNPKKGINILYKNGDLSDIGEASDHLNISSLSTPVRKHFVCYPKSQ